MVAALVLALAGGLNAHAGTLTVDVLDVGQGDSIVLHTPAGKTVLIDAGTGKPDVVPMLRARDVERVDLVIATHAHADHIGGMDEVLDAVPVRVFVDQGVPHTTATYTKVMNRIEEKGIAYKPGADGVSFNLDDGIKVELLSPWTPKLSGTRSDLNSNSVVTRVTHGERCFLFTGDSEEPTEQTLVQKGLGECDVLKVAHHGSGHSSTAAFLSAVKPDLALISCGVDNKYKHPYPETLDRLAHVGATVHRTDESGTVRVRSDGTHLSVDLLGPEDGSPRPWDDGPVEGDGRVARVRAPVPLVSGAPTVAPHPPAVASADPGAATPAREHAPMRAVEALRGNAGPAAAGGGDLDLNTASAAELDALPGIGPAKAAAIVQWREAHGPFTDLQQLDGVPGIGPATIAGLRSRVRVEPAAATP